MKRFTSYLLIAVMLLALLPFSVAAVSAEVWDGSVASGFASGSGTEDDPYIIKTAEQLAYFAEEVTGGNDYDEKFIELGADITLNNTSGSTWINSAKKFAPIGNSSNSFRGFFNGRNHTITGLYIDSRLDNVGLFANIRGAFIENLKVRKSSVSGNKYVGGVVGYGLELYVENCLFDGTVEGISEGVGGIVGYGGSSIVINCVSYGSVTGKKSVGGIIGRGDEVGKSTNNANISASGEDVGGIAGYASSVEGCYSVGNVVAYGADGVGGIVGSGAANNSHNKGQVAGSENVGGIAGSGSADGCSNEGTVSAKKSGYYYGGCGGVVGYGSASNCSNSGNVTSDSEAAGGVVGDIGIGNSIVACYNTGNVVSTSNQVGGITGGGMDFTITKSYNMGNVSGSEYVGGIVGWQSNGNVTICYNTGDVTGGENVGGIAGWLEGTISDCYTIGDIRGNSAVGGIAGYAYDALDSVASAERCYVMGYVSGYGIFGDVYDYGTINYCYNGTSSSPVYSDIQMQTQSTFKTFDFNNVWTMEGDEDYPYPELRALVKPDYILGDVNMDGTVDMFDYLMVKSFYFEVTIPTDDQFVRADMNQDGVIDMFDYLMVKTAYFDS